MEGLVAIVIIVGATLSNMYSYRNGEIKARNEVITARRVCVNHEEGSIKFQKCFKLVEE